MYITGRGAGTKAILGLMVMTGSQRGIKSGRTTPGGRVE